MAFTLRRLLFFLTAAELPVRRTSRYRLRGMVLDMQKTRAEDPGEVTSSAVSVPRQSLTRRELMIAWVALGLLGVFAYAPHVRHGGFYLDDWANGARTLYSGGVSGALSAFAKLTLYRPVLVLYVPLTYFVFGTHMAYQLAWSAALAIWVSAMLYGILRTLGVPRSHSWVLAALTLVYPWYDSTRLWETADQATLSIGLAFTGLWLALEGLRRRSLRLHLCAAGLYLISILTYEVTLPCIAAAGLLYTLRAGWRAARVRWAIDLVVVLVGGFWVGTQTNHESFGVSADLKHLQEIVTTGGTIVGRTLIPVGMQRTTLALIVLLIVAAAGTAAYIYLGVRPPAQRAAGWSIRNWLLLGGAGLAIAALGWIIFTPANPYYSPSVYGVTNRVNALAGFGLVIAIYAAFGILVALIELVLPRKFALFTYATVLCGLLLGVAYIHVLERHIRIWNTAFAAEMAGIGEMRMQFPHLPPYSTVFTSDYPVYQTLGVPIFSTDWDVNGMIKLQYKDGTLSAYPLLPGESLVCRSSGVVLEATGVPLTVAPYGEARLLNVQTGQHALPRDRRGCLAVVGSYTAGPLYLSLTY